MKVALIERLAPPPSLAEVRTAALDEAFAALGAAAKARGEPGLAVLDAGCGSRSPLAAYRDRIAKLHGCDLHEPSEAPAMLDTYVRADLCRDADAFALGSMDLILSNFTLEHLADPPAALANMRRWLRPGGWLVVTTVNRRHPFVAAYLGLAPAIRDPLQRLIKRRQADAHRLVGACNDPRAVAEALDAAGLVAIRVETVGHLARAWRRRWLASLLGLLGDLAAARSPGRRSTIVAVASAPAD